MKNHAKLSHLMTRQSGFSIMEVMIGIAIFAIGMLALASLQGALTRSTAEAKVRAEAISIAEEVIEAQRGFSKSFATAGVFDYEDIRSSNDATTPWTNTSITRNNVTYALAQTVVPYYYDLASDGFTATAPTGATSSNYKSLTVTVSWAGEDREFVIQEGVDTGDDGVTTVDNLGGGSVQISSTISAISVAALGKVSEESEQAIIAPDVSYTPGQNPDIVSLSLGNSKFKESLTPEPEVHRSDELVETTFEVVTYSVGGSTIFLRREEFAAVSCECELKVPANDIGRRPTLWLGDEYLEPEFVNKAYGLSANNTQSDLCGTCCQDHHDGGTGSLDSSYADAGAILTNPFRPTTDYITTGTFVGDHKHYKKSDLGVLSEAAQNEVYVEACRMVRKDGFFRVAQDFSRESLNVFQYDFLDTGVEVDLYSAWLTAAVTTFTADVYNNGYASDTSYLFKAPDLGTPARTAYNGGSPAPVAGDLNEGYTSLPTALGADFQQLRSRGVYVDYMIKDLRDAIKCLVAGGDAESCKQGQVIFDKSSSVNPLEIIPFFEVQTTFLNSWSESPADTPVDTTNEPLETGNTHDRGTASKEGANGAPIVSASGHAGNLGFTDTDPIDRNYILESNSIEVVISNSGTPGGSGTIVTGTISSGVRGVQARNVIVSVTNATCNYVGVTFTCLVNDSSAVMTLSNYHKRNDDDMEACSYEPTLPATNPLTDGDGHPYTEFALGSATADITYVISIEAGGCPGFVPL